MATYTKRGSSYRIRASIGYTVDGKQVSHQEATGDNANVYCSASDKQ